MYCSPKRRNHLTCYNYSELQQIAIAYNNYHNRNIIDIHDTDKKIHKQLVQLIKNCNGNEACWLKQDFLQGSDLNELEIFKPKRPKKKYQWLSSSDINAVMSQYIDECDFTFIGAIGCDFFENEKDIDLIPLNSHKYVGIIFNQDKSNGRGTHWVGVLIDNITNTLEYYDSVGKPPTKCIDRHFIQPFQEKTGYDLIYNNKAHQRNNSECGVFSINFILNRLNGIEFEDFCNKTLNDKMMNKLRQYIFRPNDD
jgi:hypothetical protein